MFNFTTMRRRLGILLLFVLVSCARVTDLKPDELPSVVVECILTTEAEQALNLSMTDWAGPDDIRKLNDAVILLSDETEGVLVGRFSQESGSQWTLPYAAVPGHAYKLAISVPGYQAITSSVRMPVQIAVRWGVDSILSNTLLFCDGNYHYYLNTLPPSTPVWICAMDVDEDGSLFLAEQIATDYAGADTFNITGQVYQSTDPEIIPFPKATGRPYHRKLLRFPPLSAQELSQLPKSVICHADSSFVVAGTFGKIKAFATKPEPGFGYINIMAVSEEYDTFLKEVVSFIMKDEAASYAELFARDNMPNNIEGGVGIFGAVTTQRMPWTSKMLHLPPK